MFKGDYRTAVTLRSRSAARESVALIKRFHPTQDAEVRKVGRLLWAVQLSATTWLSRPDLAALLKRQYETAS